MTEARVDRAVSDVVGYILVFSLVASVVAIVSVTGVGALEDARDAEQVNNAERAFDVLADNMADVHQEGAPSRSTEINLEEARLTTTTGATINITGWSNTTVDNFTSNVTTRTVRWRGAGSDGELTYAFGGVVRSGPNSSIMTNQPPLRLDPNRTLIPVVVLSTTRPQSYSGQTIRVRGIRNDPSIVHRGDATDYDNLWLNVTTANPDAWQGYLDEQPQTDCERRPSVESGKERVTCDLAVNGGREEIYVLVQRIEIVTEQ